MKKIILITVGFVVLFISSQTTYACMCIPPKNLYKISKAVFFGELIEVSQIDGRSPRTLKFKVENYWKGVENEYITITTTAQVPCGYNFTKGEKYLIYAGEITGQLETSPCRILVEEVAGKDLKKLEKRKKSKTFN